MSTVYVVTNNTAQVIGVSRDKQKAEEIARKYFTDSGFIPGRTSSNDGVTKLHSKNIGGLYAAWREMEVQ